MAHIKKGSCFWNEIKVKYDNFVIEVNKEQELKLVNLAERNWTL
jgi:hypothetical protein